MHSIYWVPSKTNFGSRLALHYWQNSYQTRIPPRGFVWIQHGLGEHGGRYQELAQFLNQFGLDCFALDLPGHGLTRIQGKMPHLAPLPLALSEVEHAYQYLFEAGPYPIKESASIARFITAHSMGSLLSLAWILKGQSPQNSNLPFFQKAFLVAPPLELALPVPAWKTTLAEFTENALPNLPIDNEIKLSDLSYEAANRGLFREDPLTHSLASPSFFLSLLHEGKRISTQPQDIEIPLCLAMGSEDPIVNKKALKKYFDQLRTHKQYLEFDKMKHEIFNEYQRRHVYESLIQWIL